MTAATHLLPALLTRLLVIRRDTQDWTDGGLEDLSALFGEGDAFVVNDAATLPASLPTDFGEARLAGPIDEGWLVLFGTGAWRDATEDRPAPPRFEVGDTFELAGQHVPVLEVSTLSPRLVRTRVEPALVWVHGSPVQYAYVDHDLSLSEVQTPYACRPWAVEMPSAGRPFVRSLRQALRDRGVSIVSLTHAAGLSATGDLALDRALPLAERYEIPEASWVAVQKAERVIAVGTSVVRALESVSRYGLSGVTDLRIGPDTQLAVVDALLSGMHEPGESHFQMLSAFADLGLLRSAHAHAITAGYRNHEFGDSTLIV
jgi:S-adenosylmethionine:tRNA ribosyltransferase-isomerase